MPIISTFFGIVIRIYQGDHNPPHFHVQYSEYSAIVAIDNGKILGGKLTKRIANMVEEWRSEHKTELLSVWKSAQAYKTLKKISPLE